MEAFKKAKWITAERIGRQMPVLGKDIEMHQKPAQASISICGLGQFSLFIQDMEVNAGIREPGWTDYRKTCLYSTYDITDYLQQGVNRIRVLIGNGMYHVDGDRYTKFRESFGPPLLIAELHISYPDGREEILATDSSWMSCPGPIVFSCVFGGEDYNAAIDLWKNPISADDGGWKAASLFDGEMGRLKKAQYPPVKIQNELEGKVCRKLAHNRVCYDFGRNFAGCIRIRVHGERGLMVRIIPGELLREDGEINQEFTGDPHYYVYTLAGESQDEVWMPRFTYYGQRYAVIETDAVLLEAAGIEQYASCRQTGYFSCSNEMYNRIHEIILGAVRSNMQSVFTDCPHREKLGWLEETHLIGPGILYNYDIKPLMEKILDDMEDAQTEEGLVPSICPEFVKFDLGFRDSPEWGSACVLLPWYLYERYRDRQLLAKHYALSKRYVEYLLSAGKGYVLNYGLGDWLDVGHYPAHPANTPIPVTATAILYQDLCVMAKTAAVLDKTDDVILFSERAKACREAFNDAFFYPLSKNYATGSQTANAMALYLDLPEEKYREQVLKNLEEDIRKRDGHFTGGDIGHPYIIRALGKCGKNNLVAENFLKTDFPSYGYQVVCQATTLCEDWDGPNTEHPVMSQNHFMLGAAEEWFYRCLAGICVDASSDTAVRIEPYFADSVDWVKCSVLTPDGICSVEWEKTGEEVRVQIQVEKKCRICLCLNGKEEIVEAEGRICVKVPL